MLIRTCSPNEQINPTIEKIMKGLLIFNSLRRVRIIINKNNSIITLQTINPNSSPTTANIKSVWASGSFSLRMPW